MDRQLSDQLCACASEELARSVNDSGMQGNYTEVYLLAAMENFSVRAQNRLLTWSHSWG